MLPMLLRYRAIHASFGFARDFGTIRDFGADVASLLHAADHIALWGWVEVFRRPEGELFPGLTVTLLVIAGAIFVRDRRQAHVNHWTLARRVLIVLTIATALISASAVIVGPWRLEPFGIRLLSVANPIKPLTASLVLALILALTSPALRRAYLASSVIGFYAVAGFVMWLFSLGPAPTLMGKPFMYRGPYTLLMLPAGLQLAARAGAFLDDGDVVPRGDRRDGVRAADGKARTIETRRRGDCGARRACRHMDDGDAARGDAQAICRAGVWRHGERPDCRAATWPDLPGRVGDVPSNVAPPAARQRLQRLLPAALRGPALWVDVA